jgi:branched-chain amino acid transport system permease protein
VQKRLIWGVVATIALVTIVIRDLEQALVVGIITGAAYGLLALGLVLVYKSSGVFNFAAGEFGTVAVFALWLAHTNGIPYLFAMLIALVVAVGLGLLTELLVVRPLFDAARVTLLVATAGVSLLLIGMEIWFGEAKPRPIDRALPQTGVSVFGTQVIAQQLLLLAILAVLAAVLAYFFNRTNLGLAVIGASQEAVAAEVVGISVKRLSSFVWGLAGLLGGLAAILAVPVNASFAPGVMTSAFLIPAFTAAVLGGFTSLPGAFVGGAIVGLAQAFATADPVFEGVPGSAATLIVFVLLVAVLAIKPSGLLGRSA